MTAAPPASDCDPMWDLDDAVYVDGPDRDLSGQNTTAYEITNASIVDLTGSYL